jgi:hypothetical protein
MTPLAVENSEKSWVDVVMLFIRDVKKWACDSAMDCNPNNIM